MNTQKKISILLTLLLITTCATSQIWSESIQGGFTGAWGSKYSQVPGTTIQQRAPGVNFVLRWNEIASNCVALDHTPLQQGEQRTFGEQIGPGRSSMALAIVHIAIFDSLNAIDGGFHSFTGIPAAPDYTSRNAATAKSAYDALVALYPSQKKVLNRFLNQDLARIPDGPAKSAGLEVGRQAAAAILKTRIDDGSIHPEPRVGVDFKPSNQPGKWRMDPISQIPIALGMHWGEVRTFVIPSVAQFSIPAPPALDSTAYASAFNEVKRLGGDGVLTPTQRTDDQTMAGLFWAYDGTAGLGTPPRLYNQIVVELALKKDISALDLARLLALVNVSMADAGIAIWASKYEYNFWRPVTGIREADEGTGPTGKGDRNPATFGDKNFMPLGAPASNLAGPNFTPPFPAYPSGHAGFGGAVFQTLRRYYGTDKIPFTFVSDELNGVTRGNDGRVRPLVPRSFASFSEAEIENGQSRIYLGIHWAFDKTEGISQGRRIANYIFNNAFRPLN